MPVQTVSTRRNAVSGSDPSSLLVTSSPRGSAPVRCCATLGLSGYLHVLILSAVQQPRRPGTCAQARGVFRQNSAVVCV